MNFHTVYFLDKLFRLSSPENDFTLSNGTLPSLPFACIDVEGCVPLLSCVSLGCNWWTSSIQFQMNGAVFNVK